MEDDAKICGACGTPFVEEAPAEKAVKVGNFSLDKKFLPVIGVAAVALIAVIVLLISLIFGGGYKSAIDNYIDVQFHGKAGKIDDLAPKAYWDWYEDEEDESIKDIKEDYEDNWDDRKDALEDEYGKRIRTSYKVKDKDKLSKKKIELIAEALNDQYDIREKSVKKGYEVEIELKVKGSEDDEEEDVDLTVIKIGSKWYLVGYYENSEDEYRVYFYD
jgi:hypothetical protein